MPSGPGQGQYEDHSFGHHIAGGSHHDLSLNGDEHPNGILNSVKEQVKLLSQASTNSNSNPVELTDSVLLNL